MAADHDARMRAAQQLLATSIAVLPTSETLRREMAMRLNDSEARVVRTRPLLAGSTACCSSRRALGHETVPVLRRATAPVGQLQAALA